MKEDLKALKDEPVIQSNNLFPVVGIGASAGGLEAFKRFIKAIPENSGMAYVLVQHLSRDHESLLPELLQKITPLPVTEISDEIKVEPDHIYIIPSNTMLMANDGVLQLSPRPEKNKNGLNLPIDLFFNSLAEVHLSHSIGVVLSGTGSDGTMGLKAIKENGGITCVQDIVSAEYPGMPESAIDGDVADFILKPEEIPVKLFEIKQLLTKNDDAVRTDPEENENFIKQVLFILRLRKGTDFSDYKRPTIMRRIFRRMVINRKEDHAGYIKFLVENKQEQDDLYRDMLIQVSSFFRDTHVFETLCNKIFPDIIRQDGNENQVRIWVAGCSSGEEAYSMAMCFRESLGDAMQDVQIFATDISESAIEKARTGVYTKKEVAGIKPERLRLFFTKTSDGYRVNKQLREMCIFAVHNFVKDPPFSKISLVSCRNVLIYMEPYLQKKALTNFHYSLVPKGTLVLGKAETAGIAEELFSVLEKNEKIYTRKDAPAKFMHVANPRTTDQLPPVTGHLKKPRLQTDFQKKADEIMLQRYTPAGVVINEALDIVHFRGNTSLYLQQAEGKPSHNILRMAKSGISFELRNLLLRMKKERQPVSKENIRIDYDDTGRAVTIEVIPMEDIADPHCLVLFHDAVPAMYAVPASFENSEHQNTRIDNLEKELAQNMEDMRSITEEQETVNNELQSANEELLSGSEELQSLNEELETSKEELQSTNEELTVLNQELISLNEQLNNANLDQEKIRARLDMQARMVQNLLMNAPAFMCTMTGPEHRYDVVNNRYQELFGKRKITGKPIMVALPELKGQGFEKILDDVYNTGIPYVGIDIPIMLARDIDLMPENRYFNFSCQPMYDEENEINAILVFGYEVTEQVNAKKLMEEISRKHGIVLEDTIILQTNELAASNKELKSRNEKLIRVNRDLEAFTFITGHDLQEPLRKIQMFTSAVAVSEKGILSSEGKSNFDRIRKSAERMQQFLKDLVEYSRIGTADRMFEQISLAAVIDDLHSEFSEALEEKNGKIEMIGSAEISGIPHQLRQLFYTLISNAIKFSRPAVPLLITIRVNTHVIPGATILQLTGSEDLLPAETTFTKIVFSDNGIGFDSQHSEKIFTVFQRLHNKDAYPGTGIGLAIAKKIMDNHHGFITASGEPGKGASFEILLPA